MKNYIWLAAAALVLVVMVAIGVDPPRCNIFPEGFPGCPKSGDGPTGSNQPTPTPTPTPTPGPFTIDLFSA